MTHALVQPLHPDKTALPMLVTLKACTYAVLVVKSNREGSAKGVHQSGMTELPWPMCSAMMAIKSSLL